MWWRQRFRGGNSGELDDRLDYADAIHGKYIGTANQGSSRNGRDGRSGIQLSTHRLRHDRHVEILHHAYTFLGQVRLLDR